MYLALSGVSMIFSRSPGNRLAPGKILGVCSHETSWSPTCSLNLVGLYTRLQLENQNLSKIERTKLLTLLYSSSGLSRCLSGKECTCQCRRTRVDPWVGKILWTHSSILAWKSPMDRGAWQTTVHGVQRVRHNLMTKQLAF